VVARAAKSILCVNGENGLASDGTLQERYEYTPYGERTVYKRAGSADEKTSAPLYESERVNTGTEQDPEWAPYGLCDLGHQSLFFDKEFGQYYNRGRMYLPAASLYQNVICSCPATPAARQAADRLTRLSPTTSTSQTPNPPR